MSPSHLIPSLSGTQNIGNIAHPPHPPHILLHGPRKSKAVSGMSGNFRQVTSGLWDSVSSPVSGCFDLGKDGRQISSRVRQVQKVSDAGICCKTIRSSDHDGQYGRVPETEKEAIIHLQLIFVLRNFFFLWHVGSSSLTKDWTWAPCTGSSVLTTGPPGKSLQLIIIWEWGLFSKRCGKSGFLCESFQFLNVGTKFFRNTKWAKLNTSVCWNQPMDLQGEASGPDDV